MPRKARLDVPGTLHHVMVRGIEGSNIFRDKEDRKAFLDRMGVLVEGDRDPYFGLGTYGQSYSFADYQRASGIVNLYATIIDRLRL